MPSTSFKSLERTLFKSRPFSRLGSSHHRHMEVVPTGRWAAALPRTQASEHPIHHSRAPRDAAFHR